MSEPTEQFIRYLMESRRHYESQYLIGNLGMAIHTRLPAPISDSLLLMTRFQYKPIRHAAMAVELDKKSRAINLLVDLDYLDALMRMGQEVFLKESVHLLHHELAHILLGHLDGPPGEFTDAMMILAKEIAVNDGWLRLGKTVYPFVRLDSFPFADQVREYALRQSYPDDWLQRHLLIYKALVAVAGNATVCTKGNAMQILRQWGVEPVADNASHLPEDAHVLVVSDGKRGYIYPVNLLQSDSDIVTMMKEIHEQVKHELISDGHYQYDATEGVFRYSPRGYSEKDRELRFKCSRLPWHQIRRLFGLKKHLGYNRRYGHLYPPDESPLVTTRPVPKTVEVFYDSSGSVSDEVLSGFVSMIKQSPFKVREHYFSTVVTDKPHTGGTSFKCIEDYLNTLDSYPDTVVVLTDGMDYGESFQPRYPERWYWIVQGDPSTPRKIGGTVILVEEE